jgi:hypothetical protein
MQAVAGEQQHALLSTHTELEACLLAGRLPGDEQDCLSA